METIKLNVKDKSVSTYLSEMQYLPQNEKTKNNDRDCFGNVSCYHLMRDELHFKKTDALKVGDTVQFELKDQSSGSRKELTNIYLYEVTEYDDVSVKLLLKEFQIKSN